MSPANFARGRELEFLRLGRAESFVMIEKRASLPSLCNKRGEFAYNQPTDVNLF